MYPEDRSRVSPSEISRGGVPPENRRPVERPVEDDPYQEPAQPQSNAGANEAEPEWVTENKKQAQQALVDPREVNRQIAERRKMEPNYLKGKVSTGGGAAVKIPEDIYDAELVNVVESEIPDQFSETPNALKPIWEWHFKVVDDQTYTGTVVRGISSRSFHNQGKAFGWYCAMQGRSLGIGEIMDLPTAFNRRCRIQVEFNKGGYSQVVNVMKASSRLPQNTPPAQPPHQPQY